MTKTNNSITTNILIAEDETDLRNLLAITLRQEGYTVFSAADGIAALDVMESEEIHLGIFDIMMPRLDGLTLLQQIRKREHFPVLFLSAKGEDFDKVFALGLGADDYMVKPFSMQELLARVKAHLRRSNHYNIKHDSKVIVLGNLEIDYNACLAKKNGQILELNAKEFRLLKYFIGHQGVVVTKKQLYQAVWEDMYYYDDNTVMVHISRLRNKIEDDPRKPLYLRTIRGIGYVWSKRDNHEE